MTPILTEKTTHVPLTPAEAFELFTRGMDTWWPSAHGKLKMDPRKGGKISDGDTEIGTIIAFDPTGYLAFTWGEDTDEETIVTVAFTATAEGCRVDLTHGTDAILGEVTDAVSNSYLRGFDLVLGSYCTCANRATVTA